MHGCPLAEGEKRQTCPLAHPESRGGRGLTQETDPAGQFEDRFPSRLEPGAPPSSLTTRKHVIEADFETDHVLTSGKAARQAPANRDGRCAWKYLPDSPQLPGRIRQGLRFAIPRTGDRGAAPFSALPDLSEGGSFMSAASVTLLGGTEWPGPTYPLQNPGPGSGFP